MSNGKFGRCAGCGAQVIWIRTKAGKNMPCNTLLVDYKADGGKDKIVLQSGEVVPGRFRLYIALCHLQQGEKFQTQEVRQRKRLYRCAVQPHSSGNIDYPYYKGLSEGCQGGNCTWENHKAGRYDMSSQRRI